MKEYKKYRKCWRKKERWVENKGKEGMGVEGRKMEKKGEEKA